MAYKVLVDFTDLQDNNYIYHEGDDFPRDGAEPTKERIAELASDKNLIGVALIKATRKRPVKGDEIDD